VLAACGTPEAPKAPPPVPPVASPGHRSVTVTEQNAGASVTLEASQELIVRLPVGATAGLEWSLVDLQPGVLVLQNSKFERALRNTNTEEAAGSTVWQLRPQAAGNVTLNFELRRPRSLQAAARTITYRVTVQ
jgi:predicted secreted protein